MTRSFVRAGLSVLVGLGTAVPAGASVVTLPAAADTYLNPGDAAHAYGDGAQLKVHPGGKVAYLRFDTRGLGAPVVRATLLLYVTNSSADGGTVYRIPDVPWDEHGLSFADVDANGDRVLDAGDGSPFVPDPAEVVGSAGRVKRGRTRRIDVSPAFVGSGDLVTLALLSVKTDMAAYASRETSHAPVLEVEVQDGGPPVTTTTTTLPRPTTTTTRPTTTTVRAATSTTRTTTTTTGTTTTIVVPPPPPGTASCLSGPGPLSTVSGTFTKRVTRSLSDGARLDARGATFLAGPSNLYPYALEGGVGGCAAGGRVLGQYDRSASWDEMHDLNNAAVIIDSAIAVEGLRVDNVTDAIRPRDGFFTVRGVHLTYVRDDCVENDHVQSGLIEDSLFDGCYVAVSSRPGSGSSANGAGGLVTVRSSLIRLQAMPGPRDGVATELGHGVMFKWSGAGPGLALYDNVFLVEQVGQSGTGAMDMPDQLGACARNVMVWTGPGAYPAPLPSCFTVTKDRGVWERAVAAWKAAHPALAD